MLLPARLAASLLLQQQGTATAAAAGAAWYATKAAKGGSAKASEALIPAQDWKAVKIPAQTADTVPVTKYPGQAFVGDLRWVGGSVGAQPTDCLVAPSSKFLCSNTPNHHHLFLLLLCRSTSGLGKGDGINNHTDKWLYVSSQAAVQCIQTPLPQHGLLNGPVMCAHTHTRTRCCCTCCVAAVSLPHTHAG